MDSMKIDDGAPDACPRAEDDTRILAAPAVPCSAGELLPVGAGSKNPRSLLTLARQLVTEGKPSIALQAVVIAMRSEGGEQAVLQTLMRAQELYRNRMQADAAVNELASLFAECAIAEARPQNPDATPPPPPAALLDASNPDLLLDVSDTSILAMSGRMQIMLDAFSDGSSFICLRCGGLVSNHRKDEHLTYWCG